MSHSDAISDYAFEVQYLMDMVRSLGEWIKGQGRGDVVKDALCEFNDKYFDQLDEDRDEETGEPGFYDWYPDIGDLNREWMEEEEE